MTSLDGSPSTDLALMTELLTPRAAPDSFVALIPVSWTAEEIDLLREVHPQVWAELLTPLEPGPGQAARFRLGDDPAGPEASLVIDEPILELNELVDTSRQPFQPHEALQLSQHRAIWRLILTGAAASPLASGRAFTRLLGTLMEAGAPAVFLPFCVQLHPASLIRHFSIEHKQPQTLVNLFVSAFNDDDWMVTRGLTVFGLPELETPTSRGLNAAFFRLMDVSCAMLAQESPFPLGSRVQVGPELLEVSSGPLGPEDKAVSINGHYGRLALQD